MGSLETSERPKCQDRVVCLAFRSKHVDNKPRQVKVRPRTSAWYYLCVEATRRNLILPDLLTTQTFLRTVTVLGSSYVSQILSFRSVCSTIKNAIEKDLYDLCIILLDLWILCASTGVFVLHFVHTT